MAHDVISELAVPGADAAGAVPADRSEAAATAAHPASRFGHEPVVPTPFPNRREARRVARSCRSMLGRHLDGDVLADALVVVVAAKVLDEASPGDPDFVAVPGEPRVSSARFDTLVDRSAERLAASSHRDLAPIDVPELVGHQVLHDLGPYSILGTAERPDGHDILCALVAELVVGDEAPRCWSDLAAAVAGTGDAHERALEVVAAAVRDAVADPDAVLGGPDPDEDQVVDLRDSTLRAHAIASARHRDRPRRRHR